MHGPDADLQGFLHGEDSGYRPVDYVSCVLNVGVATGADGLTLRDLAYGYRFPIALTMPEYVRHGARLPFTNGWARWLA